MIGGSATYKKSDYQAIARESFDAVRALCDAYPESDEDNEIENIWARYGSEFASAVRLARQAALLMAQRQKTKPKPRKRAPGDAYGTVVVERIRALAAAGRTLKSIASETQVPRSTVQRICADVQKPYDHRGRKGLRRVLHSTSVGFSP